MLYYITTPKNFIKELELKRKLFIKGYKNSSLHINTPFCDTNSNIYIIFTKQFRFSKVNNYCNERLASLTRISSVDSLPVNKTFYYIAAATNDNLNLLFSKGIKLISSEYNKKYIFIDLEKKVFFYCDSWKEDVILKNHELPLLFPNSPSQNLNIDIPAPACYNIIYNNKSYTVSNPIKSNVDSITCYAFGRGIRTFLIDKIQKFKKIS